jgi:hypothetical protein
MCAATGLDSVAAMAVMDAVRRLASEISVVCTVHQVTPLLFFSFFVDVFDCCSPPNIVDDI